MERVNAEKRETNRVDDTRRLSVYFSHASCKIRLEATQPVLILHPFAAGKQPGIQQCENYFQLLSTLTLPAHPLGVV